MRSSEAHLSVRIGLRVNCNVTSLRQGLRHLSLPPLPLPDLPDLFVGLLVPLRPAPPEFRGIEALDYGLRLGRRRTGSLKNALIPRFRMGG
jgi:hypothetical protein